MCQIRPNETSKRGVQFVHSCNRKAYCSRARQSVRAWIRTSGGRVSKSPRCSPRRHVGPLVHNVFCITCQRARPLVVKPILPCPETMQCPVCWPSRKAPHEIRVSNMRLQIPSLGRSLKSTSVKARGMTCRHHEAIHYESQAESNPVGAPVEQSK